MVAVICLSSVLFITSIILIFFKDVAWDLQEWSNSASGRVSERTDVWEFTANLIGVLGIAGSIILIIWGVSVS